MALTGSGAISFANIRDEFSPGSNTSVSLSDYYRQGTKIKTKAGDNNATHLAANVPTSGALALSDYYNAGLGFQFTITSDVQDQNLSTIFGDDYDLDYPKLVVVNAGVTVGGTSTSTPAINIPSGAVGTITITNNGNIYGKGGSAGAVGGDAIVASSTCNVVNNGNIKSGGGGGGNGGAGGAGTQLATAVLSNFTDIGGSQSSGSGNVPQNNAPSWFTAYGGDNDLNGQGAVGDRKWRGINGNSPQSGGIGQTGQFQVTVNTSGFFGHCANRGPFYFSFQVDRTASYTFGGSINNGTYGSGYGSVLINISTSTSAKSQGQGGGDYTPGQKANLNASTTYYFCANLTTSGNRDLYYNTFQASMNLGVQALTSGGSGGAGGAGASYNASAGSGSAGGSGGTNAGSGGAGGAGGALGQAGTNGSSGSNGSGSPISFPSSAPSNGSSGGTAGAAGKYINGISNVTLTNNGTVAGNTA